MRPGLIFLSALLLECFLLFVLISPKAGLDQSQEAIAESTQWRDDPTPQQERAIRRQLAWEQWKPPLVWTLLCANGVFIIAYGVRWLSKRPWK